MDLALVHISHGEVSPQGARGFSGGTVINFYGHFSREKQEGVCLCERSPKKKRFAAGRGDGPRVRAKRYCSRRMRAVPLIFREAGALPGGAAW